MSSPVPELRRAPQRLPAERGHCIWSPRDGCPCSLFLCLFSQEALSPGKAWRSLQRA